MGTSSWAGAFRADRKLNEDLAELIQSNIEYGYQQFISAVAMSRGLEVEMVDTIARGRVWTGRQVKEFGLIDEIGGLDDAIQYAAEKAGIADKYDLVWVEQELSSLDQFLMSGVAKAANFAGIKLFNNQTQSIEKIIEPMKPALSLVMNTKSGVPTPYAHCFCEVNMK